MKNFSINKNQSAVFITLLVLVFLGAGYLFIYLPNNERRIKEQRFNALQNIDRNIHTKIENSKALLNNLLNNYQHFSEVERRKLIKYIDQYSTSNFILSQPSKIISTTEGSLSDSMDLDSTYSIEVNNITREINLFISKQEMGNFNERLNYKIGMKFSFKQFIQNLLPVGVFDEYLIFSEGQPVFESFPSGISRVKEDSLLVVVNGISSSLVLNQEIGGNDYKLFLQPVGFDSNNEWIIAGLLTNKHFLSERNQLPTQMVLLLATILLICIVAFPWLKLYQIGSKDRLTIKDGIASIFISMLLVSFMFFIFFDQNFPFRPSEKNDSKASLANGINKAFKTEIDSAFKKLTLFDSLLVPMKNSINFRRNIVKLNTDSIAFSNADTLGISGNTIKLIKQGIDINQVFWLDKSGNEIFNWSADDMNAPPGKYFGRDYFKKIKESREYLLNNDSNKRFYLEQLISWTSGTFRSVISMRSKMRSDSLLPNGPFVAVLSFNFKGLSNVVMPEGFLFAITDNEGKVLYHSDPSKNLNENLLNVFSKSNNLKSCLDANAPGTFSTTYWGKDYNVKVKPVSGLPYFIVIMEDRVYNETRDIEIYSFTFSMLLFFFGYLLLTLFAIFLVSSKRSFFKKQLFDTSWIGPKKSSHPEYVLASLFNVTLLLLLAFFFKRTTFLEFLFMLLFAVTVMPLFLNSIFAERYYREKRNVFQYKKLAKYCLWTFVFILDILAFKLLEPHHVIGLLGFELLVITLAICIYSGRKIINPYIFKLKASNQYKKLFGNWNYINSFSFMLLSRLIITSGLPVIFFYICSYNYEQNLGIRYKQIDFASRLLYKFPGKLPVGIINPSVKYSGLYVDRSVIDSIAVITKSVALKESGVRELSKEEEGAIWLLKMFRLNLTDEATKEDKYFTSWATDTSFFFNHFLDQVTSKGKGTISYFQTSWPNQYLKIQSEDYHYHYPSAFSEKMFDGVLFWLLLAGSVILFYFIINNIIKKLFALNLPDLQVWKELDNEILNNKNWDQPLFVIGLPGSGKKKYLLDKIQNGEIKMKDGSLIYFNEAEEEKNNVFIAELINIPSTGNEEADKIAWKRYTKNVFNENHRLIIVNHFEYNIKDAVSNRFKLEFLEHLYLDNKCKIIILSTIHPVAFLDSAMEHGNGSEDISIPGHNLERWHVLLGHYRIVILPLQLSSNITFTHPLRGSVIKKNGGTGIWDVAVSIRDSEVEVYSGADGKFLLPDYPFPFTINISLEGFYAREITINNANDLQNIELDQSPAYQSAMLVRQETNHTYFLKKLQTPAYDAGREFTEQLRVAKFDELAFKFQISSHYFYMYIWQSLTKEEKFLLYDLAEDNLVNSFDNYNLSMLLAKGVVINPDGTLKIFNKGFRNFILTAIGNSEAMKIKNQIKENGNWNTLKYPLQLVIIAILAFLFTSQEEAFAKLISYVAALGAGVPALIKLFSLFDKNAQKTA